MILDSLIVLLACQLFGEVISVAADIPVPGPVIGMAILTVALAIRGGVPAGLVKTSGSLLDHLALLFVPAGVGVLAHLPLLAEEVRPIVGALIGSTLLAIAVTALVMAAVQRLGGRDGTS
jgi:holin-like protein